VGLTPPRWAWVMCAMATVIALMIPPPSSASADTVCIKTGQFRFCRTPGRARDRVCTTIYQGSFESTSCRYEAHAKPRRRSKPRRRHKPHHRSVPSLRAGQFQIQPGMYHRTTSQGGNVIFTVGDRQVDDFHIDWAASCVGADSSPQGQLSSSSNLVAPNHLPFDGYGGFSASTSYTEDTGGGSHRQVTIMLHGQFTASDLSGTFSAHLDNYDATGGLTSKCDTPAITW